MANDESPDVPDQPIPTTPDQVPTRNPIEGLDVDVFIPTLEVRWVNAGALEDYELWFASFSLVGGAALGFLGAFVGSIHEDAHGNVHLNVALLVTMVVLGLLTWLAGWRAKAIRERIHSQSRSYKMRVTGR